MVLNRTSFIPFIQLGTMLVVMGFVGVGAACDPLGGPMVVEALVPDDSARGGVALQDVTLERVVDLRTGDRKSVV